MRKANVVKEIIRCGKEPLYFIDKYAKIEHPLRGIIPFRLFKFQEDILKDFINERFNIINKGRQLGLSTLIAAYSTWMILYHKNKNILVVATKLDTATNIIDKVKIILDNLPEDLLLCKIVKRNVTSITLSNGSRIKAVTTSKDVGRSEALTLLVVDEAAHVENLKELWAGVYPTLSRGGRCILASTPNGTGNHFYRTYVDAEANLNDFKARTVNWRAHPEQDDKWFKKITTNMSKKEIAQEYEAEFLASGNTFVDPEDIRWLESMIIEPSFRQGIDKNLWVWEGPLPNEEYLVTADVARGDGQDNSTLHCMKVSNCEVVAEYKGKLPTLKFADMLYEIGMEYNAALLAPENNTFGAGIIERLIERRYPNLFVEGNQNRRNAKKETSMSVLLNEDGRFPGFSTNSSTRPLILSKLAELIETRKIKIYSSRFCKELNSFVWRNGKAKAEKDCNDDLIISAAIASWLTDTTFSINEKARDINIAILNGISVMSRSFDNVQGSGKDVMPIYTGNSNTGYSNRELKARGPSGEIIDFNWLIG